MKKTKKQIEELKHTRAVIGATLRKFREDAQLSQEEAGKLIGVEQNYVSAIELGKIKNIDTYIAYAKAVGSGIICLP